jgi:hypothetical protein
VLVVATKANGDESWENKGKVEAGYDRFFEAIREGGISEFRSTLQAAVEAKAPEPEPAAA